MPSPARHPMLRAATGRDQDPASARRGHRDATLPGQRVTSGSDWRMRVRTVAIASPVRMPPRPNSRPPCQFDSPSSGVVSAYCPSTQRVKPSPTNGCLERAPGLVVVRRVLADDRHDEARAVRVAQVDRLVEPVDDGEGQLGAVLPLPLGGEAGDVELLGPDLRDRPAGGARWRRCGRTSRDRPSVSAPPARPRRGPARGASPRCRVRRQRPRVRRARRARACRRRNARCSTR